MGGAAARGASREHDREANVGATHAGVNEVELEWPLPRDGREDELERGARSLERGVYPDPLPAFGEVHAFTASAA